MPKLPHEALVQLVRHAPALIPDLLWPGERSPGPVRITAAEFVDLNFAEHRADVVLGLGGAQDRPDEALVVEVQVERDPRKRWTWPVYVAGLRARLGCPVTLVVVSLDPEVARWCAEPIDLGRRRTTVHPWVLGPEAVPVVTDLERARELPELAVLSVAAHADEPGAEHIALVALEATRELDDQRGIFYPDFVVALLGRVARTALEKLLMTTGRWEPLSDMFRRPWLDGIAEGEARGKASMLLKLLQLRGFALGDEQRERVLACRDEAQLDAWAARVLTATRLDEVFAD
ncbi:hypothetical protein SAMN02745121_03086 [Nannocystis exedens]|uniref:DUF4351 domain-containing protein n=1 Tax=Nannocystis exedens TaxID=54 RepID=A0A1I1Y0I3_9BACT|nr:hypothetical protein [Nannocystis exedens]PCC71733.1 hypothetical protein NAEX_04812 [Nannocystis exedens]SFE12919.1 hypothetical protein SAMN02745121_03086 [Nannocystis exedens]